MSRPLTSRLAAQPLSRTSAFVPMRCPYQMSRFLSQSAPRCEDAKPPRAKTVQARPKSEAVLESIFGSPQPSRDRSSQNQNTMTGLSQNMVFDAMKKSNIDTSLLSGGAAHQMQRKDTELEPYHLHVYSHKHNTHITCTKPNREPIISMSCGNIGYRKSRRGTFDSAYSLTKYVLERLIHTGWPMKIQRLELVLRGFGQGREAAVKVLMSPEGKVLRDKIVRVADSTRIKFGGTRSEKPRRL